MFFCGSLDGKDIIQNISPKKCIIRFRLIRVPFRSGTLHCVISWRYGSALREPVSEACVDTANFYCRPQSGDVTSALTGFKREPMENIISFFVFRKLFVCHACESSVCIFEKRKYQACQLDLGDVSRHASDLLLQMMYTISLRVEHARPRSKAVLQVYQAKLLKDADQSEGVSPNAIVELHRTTDLNLHSTKQVAHAMVDTEWHVWLNLLGLKEQERSYLLDALSLAFQAFWHCRWDGGPKVQGGEGYVAVAFEKYIPCSGQCPSVPSFDPVAKPTWRQGQKRSASPPRSRGSKRPPCWKPRKDLRKVITAKK